MSVEQKLKLVTVVTSSSQHNVLAICCYWIHGFMCSLQAYIREQIVQTVAIIHKRSMLDRDKSTMQCSEDALFTDIACLIHTGSQSSVSSDKLIINVASWQAF